MIDVVHSVSLDCSQYFPTPTGTFPATTPTSLHSSGQHHLDFNSASLDDFDLTGEQLIARLNLLDPASLFAAMAFQPTQLFHLSGLSGQEDSQSNENTPSSHTEIYDSAMLQSNMTPSFVEPSTTYFALPATTAPTYYNGYGSGSNNNNRSSLPTSSAVATSNNNLSSVSSRTNHHPGYMENYPAPQPHHGHHGHHNHHHHLEHNPHASRVGMSNPQLIVPPSHHYYQREVYQGSVPSSIGRISRQHNPVQNHHPKPISVTIGTGHSSHRQPNNLAAAIASPIFVAPTYNLNSGGNNTMHLPLFEPNNSGSPSPINNSTPASPETTTKTTPTYSYSGPPKSYYSRLPLYDRPFKCDQCPQSFNRNHDLKRHKRIHLAVKPYPCPCCEKQFSRKDALKRHILVKGCTKKDKVADKSSTIGEKYDSSPIERIESYVDINQTKTEPTEYGMSI